MVTSMKKYSNIIQWIVAVFFLLAIPFSGLHASSLLLFAAALLIAPIKPLRELLSKVKIKNGIAVLLAVILFFTGIVISPESNISSAPTESTTVSDTTVLDISTQPTSTYAPSGEVVTDLPGTGELPAELTTLFETHSRLGTEAAPVSSPDIPAYSGSAFVKINNNTPFFSKDELKTTGYESYSPLDRLGRCGVALACVGRDTMPGENEERKSIGSIIPSGWVQAQYENVPGKYLYNRCHLIGWQLSAENANRKNLITGTKYLNTKGMLPFENMVADYIKETGNHVAYRITPVFEGENLLASGVQMEAYSVEDGGEGICFNVYCYNVQPDIKINYQTGKSSGTAAVITTARDETLTTERNNEKIVYRAPTGKRYHLISTCAGKNSYSVTLSQAKAAGLTPCQKCAQ